jgi:hypothetical protein
LRWIASSPDELRAVRREKTRALPGVEVTGGD